LGVALLRNLGAFLEDGLVLFPKGDLLHVVLGHGANRFKPFLDAPVFSFRKRVQA
jgi:hypothetical protein